MQPEQHTHTTPESDYRPAAGVIEPLGVLRPQLGVIEPLGVLRPRLSVIEPFGQIGG
ncbi:MAG TPA: hypothetical protein VGB52_08425 [Actinomycetota bacterium]